MDTRRLFLLLIFATSSIMLWDAWERHHAPKPALQAAPATGGTTAAAMPAGIPTPTVAATPTPAATLPAPGGTSATPGATTTTAPIVRIKTDILVADISAAGGEIVRLELPKHAATVDPTKALVLFEPAHRYAAQSGLIGEGLPNHRTLYRIVDGPREMGSADQLTVRLESDSTDGIKTTKLLTFKRGSYAVEIAHEITNGSQKPLSAHAYFQFQRDGKAPEGESAMVMTFTGPSVYTDAEKFQKVNFEDIAKDKAKFAAKADNGWLAMVQHYFVAAWLPEGKTTREFFMKKLDTDLYTAGLVVPVATLAPGASARVSMPLYAGPQEQAKLKSLAPGLDLVVDYGWLHIIAAPIFWLLQIIFDVVGNWGWAIVLLTVLIKLVFFPLSAASYKSMAKMKAVTPRLMALKEKFGDDRQRLNQEMMDLYRKEKINPLGGCLPILVQIPVFIALYWVLLGAVEMRGAPWLGWITDLSAQDPYYILPVIMVASMIIQTKLNPTPPDPIQAKVMMAMPFIFGIMFFWFPSGLVLYWVVNNILSIAQQWHITRLIEGGAKK
jgi:YidC/Oxa1 family membrane protein insertase